MGLGKARRPGVAPGVTWACFGESARRPVVRLRKGQNVTERGRVSLNGTIGLVVALAAIGMMGWLLWPR